ncbi:hypothetical protein DV737_g2524, partial [Chaetothyriales sp. CBS 132003]
MKAYWFDNSALDQREAHDSGKPVDPLYLAKLGVLYSYHPDTSTVDVLAKERDYKNRDEITVSPTAMGAVYEDKVKSFFNEHLHEDEEIRYIRDGAGYFDVRSEGDDWVRIRLEKDDLIILPAGIYHRFTTDENNVSVDFFLHVARWSGGRAGGQAEQKRKMLTGDMRQQYIKAVRLFKDEPKWTPLNRGQETDVNEYRKAYLESRGSNTAIAT